MPSKSLLETVDSFLFRSERDPLSTWNTMILDPAMDKAAVILGAIAMAFCLAVKDILVLSFFAP
jgi:hypothetical protein